MTLILGDVRKRNKRPIVGLVDQEQRRIARSLTDVLAGAGCGLKSHRLGRKCRAKQVLFTSGNS